MGHTLRVCVCTLGAAIDVHRGVSRLGSFRGTVLLVVLPPSALGGEWHISLPFELITRRLLGMSKGPPGLIRRRPHNYSAGFWAWLLLALAPSFPTLHTTISRICGGEGRRGGSKYK